MILSKYQFCYCIRYHGYFRIFYQQNNINYEKENIAPMRNNQYQRVPIKYNATKNQKPIWKELIPHARQGRELWGTRA